METAQILSADVLDIIFDGRNKAYGAYDLRLTYNQRVKKSLLLTGFLFLIICFTILWSTPKKSTALNVMDYDGPTLADVKPPEAKPIIPPPVQKPTPPPVNAIQFTKPVLANNTEAIKPIEEIHDNQVIASETIKSDNTLSLVKAPQDIVESNVLEIPKANNEEVIFKKVEREAEFPGGDAAWFRYLQKSLANFNPSENGAPEGKYQVIVKFIVSKHGQISDVQAETNYGYGLEQQAIECIKNGPGWKPALQNGVNVNAYRRQPITFLVQQ
ncbi:MAG: hypothetical protein RL172_2222 [Bacteroidota bacterium]|jgi:periplasmic protein TonB